jgi:hypothetical protein
VDSKLNFISITFKEYIGPIAGFHLKTDNKTAQKVEGAIGIICPRLMQVFFFL